MKLTRGILTMTNSEGVSASLEFQSHTGWLFLDPKDIGKRFIGGSVGEVMLYYDDGTAFRLGPGWEHE